MMRIMNVLVWLFLSCISTSFQPQPALSISSSLTVDSLGACQGASYQNGAIYLYGDREAGIIRKYKFAGDSLQYLNNEIKLTLNDSDVINHPTGMAFHENLPFLIGNSIRLNKEGTLWRSVIYCIDWKKLQTTQTLDSSLLNTIDDDTCIQGTRPEYVRYNNQWYVATADYGDKGNEVRLYNAETLSKARKTTDAGVLYKKFTCTPWVQNLYWMNDKGILVLVQNQVEGRKWRFTYVDLSKSILSGKQSVIKEVNIERGDELEGFTFLPGTGKGIAVTSSRTNNVNLMNATW